MVLKLEDIALVDMDGTLCDFEGVLLKDMQTISSPHEPAMDSVHHFENAPDYMKRRKDIILANAQWWTALPKLKLGFDIWRLLGQLEFRRVILTQGPRRNPTAWMGKKLWIDVNLGPDTDIIITRDKGLVYGKVLVDDYPAYVERWLQWRPRGVVIMPANNENAGYHNPNVIRYDGKNLKQVKQALMHTKNR